MNKLKSRTHKRRARILTTRAGILIVFAAMVIAAGNNWRARAQTNRFVSTSGNDQGGSNDCSNSGQPCATIQNAINHSGGGDEIDLGPGTYTENVTVSQSVTIRGDAVTGSIVDGNHAESVFIINSGVSATLETLTIQNGTAQPDTRVTGGGIHNGGGNLTVIGCTITGNRAPETTIQTGPESSTTYAGIGGGIYNVNGSLTLINSTVSGNFASAEGSGIDNHDTATLINSTIAFNNGGGIENESVQAILNITNTLLSNNSGGDYDNFNGTGQIGTNSHNFVGRGTVPGALTGDPLLGPLRNNGGPTLTFALLAGSLAIDAGDDSVLGGPLNLTTDQRGAGFPRDGCSHVDIGAYEAHVGDPPAITCPGDVFAVTDPGQPTATVTLSATAVDACGGPLTSVYTIGATTITSPHAFPVGFTSVTATATDSQGGTASCSFDVFVHCVPPTVICPGNISVFTDPAKTTATVAFAATASDPCSGALTPTYTIGKTSISSPFAFPVGTTTVTASASNTGGRSSCTFTVTVTCLPPTVSCPGNIAVYSDPGRATATVSFAATASDPCDGALTPVYTIGDTVIASPYAFPPGVTTVTAAATGSNGLMGSCTFTVNVTLLDKCIQDDHSGDTFRFNSTTGQYVYTRCKDKFTMTGTGVVRTSTGMATLTDSRSDRRINAAANPGTLTGRANITLILAPGVYETITVNQTNPSATCSCP
ncbi:MAG: HYR domain-containing protein [Blastocatellia bacterium]